MQAYEWIEKIKEKYALKSDYAVAQLVGLHRTAISNYRRGIRNTLDESTAIKVAEVLGEKPEAVLLDQYAEQVKTPSAKAALHDLSRRLCILC